MRKHIYFIVAMLLSLGIKAQQNIIAHNSGNTMYASPTSVVDSIKFDTSDARFHISGNTGNPNIPRSIVDSLTFSSTAVNLTKIYIIYKGSDNATIINPYANQGVNITATGGTVNVVSTATISNLEYNLLGTSTTGSLTMSSTLPANFVMNNLNITNASGPAINITGAQTHTFTLQAGTVNSITDGSSSTKNGTLQTDGKIVFAGTGTLNIKGIKKHGVSTSSVIEVQNGNINVISAASDGFHSEGYVMSNGTAAITATGDAIDAGDSAVSITGGNITATLASADVKAIKTGTNTITISGGTFSLNLTGAQSKAISAKGNITFNGGNITASLSGAAVLTASGSGYDPSYSTAIKSDAAITVNSGTFTLTLASTASGGKGFSADGELTINGGTFTINNAGTGTTYTNTSGVIDSYTASGLKSDTNIKIYAGTLNITSTGVGGKGISADGEIVLGNTGAANNLLTLNVSTTGNRFLVSGTGNNADYANPKAVKAEGNLTLNSGTITINCTQTSDGGEGLESKNILTINGGVTEISTWDDAINAANAIVINGGTTYCYAKNNDGIDSNGTLTITGGTTIANGARTPEEGFDCDNNAFKITGGIIVGTGGATSNPTSVSTQKSVKVTTTAGNHVYIKNASNQTILMYKVPAFYGTGSSNSVTLLFTNPNFVNGTYTIYRGGTISGGTESHGYVTGGTYSGGTSSTFTVSSYLTTVN
jgi:hypothetical protein